MNRNATRSALCGMLADAMELTETQRQVLDWLAHGETGLSSECMAMYLAFGKLTEGDHPHDPGDLNRCLKLLRAAPGLRERLPEMAELSAEWEALVARWAEIEAMQMKEVGIDGSKGRQSPRTFSLMQETLNAVRA